MNMFKKNGGFTLVELIVVIAILAILAAVAIPAYSGYISKAQEANDMTLLDSVKTAVAFVVMEDEPTAQIDKIVVSYTAATAEGAEDTVSVKVDYTVPGEDPVTNSEIYTAVKKLAGAIVFKSGNGTATMEDGKWTITH